ncbi:hypothetical protein ABNQ39_00345 (plasmid) [Azospirillum sp. A26]|uniref:hypothetical protein n=1 Tax=Azospirillum sp. A26 TaxID=3160607 RepID=UPI00366E0EEC
MIDIRSTIVPKSDQLNADDLIGGPRTIKVSRVSVLVSDQPVSIHFEGDNGKPYLPCKSMRRVLVNAWGPDGSAYVGRSMTLYRDDTVAFGGQQVGGIRISHLSHIDRQMTMALTATRGSRKPFVVRPLAPLPEERQAPDTPAVDADAVFEEAAAAARNGRDVFTAWWNSKGKEDAGNGTAKRVLIAARSGDLRAIADAADAARSSDDDGFPGDIP